MIAISAMMVVAFTLYSCKDTFLEIPASGQLSDATLNSKEGIEGLLVGAYSLLLGRGGAGDAPFYTGSNNWLGGSVQGGEANKGSDAGDQAVAEPVMIYDLLPTSGPPEFKWIPTYAGISRCNAVLRILPVAAADVTDADKVRISAEARFLRGHYHFELKKYFNNVPYIDDAVEAPETVGNTADIWPNIEADFQFAYDNLPETQSAAGRANKWAAAAYLAKVHLYQGHFSEATALFNTVIANGKTTNGLDYALAPKYSEVFNVETENSSEHIFSAQAAVGTGTIFNTQSNYVLNFPYNGGPAGCCGFFQPSFDAVNSYRTDANGLPLLDGSYNSGANAVKNDQGIISADPFALDAGNLDPRLDHTVGRRGIPFLDWQDHPGKDWIRDQTQSGPYTSKKFMISQAQYNTYTDGSSWTRGYTAVNYPIIRFTDVLLMAAESEIEGGSLETARGYVNQVRARAANPSDWVKLSDGSNAANYVIGLYNTPWTDKNAARAALRMERKLELSQEGHRFFDLVRWGVVKEVIDAYIANERLMLASRFQAAVFTANQDEYWPIPQAQIDLQPGILTQNPGY